jgi:hypothetical protein
VTVVEQICGASCRCRLLHDDYSNIAHLQIEFGIDVEGIDGGGRKHRAGREGKNLIMMAQGFGVGEEEVMGEMILQVRIEGIRRAC